MSKTYCGACRGERGCSDCRAVSGLTRYNALTEFYEEDSVGDVSEEKVCLQSIVACEEFLLAADLGTTTLAFVCGDGRGQVIASYGCENPQRKVAADVVGRIDAALHGQKDSLSKEIREALAKGFLFVLNKGLEKVQNREKGSKPVQFRFGIAGNTVMQHLLFGYPLEGMAKTPFQPYSISEVTVPVSELFSETPAYALWPEEAKTAEVTVLPCFSAFVGGDLYAGACAYLREDREKPRMLIDLGTNGEILLSANGMLYGTAAAMGCAFEGGRFAYASDLFRLTAEVLEEGVAEETGLLREPYFSEGFYGLLQEDIREFQLAKGALRAGIELLCQHVGVQPDEIDKVFLAGGLGAYCGEEDLLRTGLLPGQFAGKIKAVGNSCICGILFYLKNRPSVVYCKRNMLNLAEQLEFEALYYRFMNFDK